MYARFFFLYLIFIMTSVSFARSLFDELQTTVALQLDAGFWQHRAEGLATVEDSKFYRKGFVPTISFDNMRHYGSCVHIRLKGFAAGYCYFGSSILGEIYPPDYKTAFKDAKGVKIRIIKSYYKNQKYDFEYLFKNIAGVRLSWQKYYYYLSPTDNWNEQGHPLGGAVRFVSFCRGWSVSLFGNRFVTKNLSLKWCFGSSPRLKGRYEYPHTEESGGVSVTNYSEYFGEVLIGYRIKGGIVPAVGFLYKKRSAKNINVTDTFKNIVLQLEYTF
jgi:hypothetical protein